MDQCTVGWKQDRRKPALWPQAVCRARLEKPKSNRAGRKDDVHIFCCSIFTFDFCFPPCRSLAGRSTG